MGSSSLATSIDAEGDASTTALCRSALKVDVYAGCISLRTELSERTEALRVLEGAIAILDAKSSASNALDRIAALLLVPGCTLPVASCFKPILVELATRALDQAHKTDGTSVEALVKTLHSFALLIGIFPPDIYELLTTFVGTAAFATLPQSISEAPVEVRNQVLLDLYRLVAATSNALPGQTGRSYAEWAHRIVLSSDPSDSVSTRLLALHFFTSQQGISENGRYQLQQKCLDTLAIDTSDPYTINAVAPLAFEPAGINSWTLETEEFSRIQLARSRVAQTSAPYLDDGEGETAMNGKRIALSTDDLSPEVCCVGGVLLARSRQSINDHSAIPLEDRFIETTGISPSLSQLALRLSLHYPILISGPSSSGKSSLIRHLSQLLKGVESSTNASHLLTIQLGDQSGIDAKQLLGSFVSSPTQPGKFEWTEGALTRALRQGKWIVLEDIDKAGSEVLSTIAQLVEQLGPTKVLGTRPTIDLGTRGKVVAGHGFALFATRATASSLRNASLSTGANFLGSSHWSEVFVAAPSQADLQRATQPSAASSRSSATGASVSAGSIRTATLRDLIKWCRRVERLLSNEHALRSDPLSNPVQQEEIFIEACDIFLGSVPPAQEVLATSASATPSTTKAFNGKSADRYGALVELLAQELGLTSERAWWALKQRIPELSVRSADPSLGVNAMVQSIDAGSSLIRVGRCELQRRSKAIAKRAAPVSRKFAMTKPSLLLLERLTVATALGEPVLLVGETGTGKTTVIQHLASLLGQPMVALNLSQQTESGDLLGAFKPLDPKVPATEIHDQWSSLFARTFSSRRNARFVDAERKAFIAGKWSRLALLWRESAKMASQRQRGPNTTGATDQDIASVDADGRAGSGSRKKRKTERGAAEGSPSDIDDARAEAELDREWVELDAKARDFGVQHGGKKKNLVFSFVEGPLVKALRQGDWILLDEINLAAAETLDSLTGLLQSPTSSITLTERGDLEPIPRHPNFRLFACMNPATDVGKKDLPASLRSRFTELYVPSPDTDRDALTAIVEKYIGEHALGDRGAIMDVAECYAEIRRLAQQHELADGANQRPHFSIRTLSRALTFATDIAPQYGLRRGLWEGFIMAFTLLLDETSARTVRAIIERHTLTKAKNARAIATYVPPAPTGAEDEYFVQVGPFWLTTGPAPLDAAEDYILTPSVQNKLVGLSRTALTRRSPVLIQGPTSAGKTSAVEYLARRTGHRFVRINNHEHTDIQEYIGSYASDPDSGKLSFQEGLLVKALRRGDWIVLDELNLAPTDVLEALNRLLDDNRELVIPETGEVVKPHPHFMLFATQNPPGLYAGRKVLSRAFRNRFLELHFDDVPRAELETILTNRCKIAPSYSSRIVGVFEELQKRRQAGRVFETKQAFVTLRDLFRWGNREAVGYQQLAENGYMLIAERARRSDDKDIVKEVIEKVMRVKLDVERMYLLEGQDSEATLARIGRGLGSAIIKTLSSTNIVKTSAFQRLLCLVATSLRYNEPVLLVGETGAGKTSVCEVLATAFGRDLHCVNCHQNTDTADLLGGQRPLRNRAAQQNSAKAACIEALNELHIPHNLSGESKLEDVSSVMEAILSNEPEQLASLDQSQKATAKQSLNSALREVYQATALFEWRDGPLVQAMRAGDHILLDEISLADDSVLERLNSVLEPARTLVLAERATSSSQLSSEADISSSQITGADGFQVLATMNPGGDYGKKELSPALRNRFTEIWVPHVDIRSDLIQIINAQWRDARLLLWTEPIIDFSDWFIHQIGGRDQSGLGLRDLLTWASFMNELVVSSSLDPALAFAHGASLTIIDGLGALPATAAMTAAGLAQLRNRCLARVAELIAPQEYDPKLESLFEVDISEERLRIGPYTIQRGSIDTVARGSGSFSFGAKTSASNAMRVLRALSVPGKSVLLEGSPGAGKTSLITALAAAAARPLTRINLSDQTELVDLFGSDMPLEGGGPGEFAWRDAAFLTAMQQGEWVLLDEMNLASQTVLEGLNSCLDHRGTVYVPELGRSFTKHRDFRIFAAQNPHHQGGGRKGLPKSFLNRFIKVHIEELTRQDILAISSHLYPNFDTEQLRRMIQFNFDLHHEVVVKHSFGRVGAPWEFNLRDLMRWLDLLHTNLGLNKLGDPVEHLASLYIQRFRSISDRQAARELFRKTFGTESANAPRILSTLTRTKVRIGHAVMQREPVLNAFNHRLVLLPSQLPMLEALMDCVHKEWLSILVGPTGCGKTSVVRLLAQLTGARLEEFQMNSGTDTMDLIGTFEQYDPHGRIRHAFSTLLKEMQRVFEMVAASSTDHLAAFLAARDVFEMAIWNTKATLSAESMVSAFEAVRALNGRIDDDALRAALEDASAAAIELQQTSQDTERATGRFEWIDGPLLRALQEGHWLLLDNANLCSASVLDRLNSLFEVNGSLVISERGVVDGKVPVVRPHPNFRVFMCLDPRHGELSRAMRNRGIEIALLPQQSAESADLERLMQLCGVESGKSISLEASAQRMLMDASLRGQMLQRGLEEREEGQLSDLPSVHRREAAIWAASQLTLTNTTLASATLPLLLSSVEESASEASASLLIRLSSPKVFTLIRQVLIRRLLTVSGITSALLQDVVSNPTPLLTSREAVQHRLADTTHVTQELVDSFSVDLRYDDNVSRLLGSQSVSAESIGILLAAMIQRLGAQQIMEAASTKRMQDLSILERSARLSSTAMVHDEDQATTTVRNVFPLIAATNNMVLASVHTDGAASWSASTLRQVASLLRSAEYLQKLCATSELDYSSIQILVRFMSDLLRDTNDGGIVSDAHLLRTIDSLGGSLQLTSGKALFPIWSLFGANEGMQTSLYRLICDELTQLPAVAGGDLVKNALDVAATLCVASKQSAAPSQLREIMQLGWQTLKMIRSAGNRAAIKDQQHAAVGSAATAKAEAILLSLAEVSTKTPDCLHAGPEASRMKIVMNLFTADSSPAIQAAAASCKSVLWSLDSGSTISNAVLADFSWIRRLWLGEAGQVSTSDGPACLLRPVALQTLLESRFGSRSLEEKSLHDASVGRMIRSVGAALPASSSFRAEKLTEVLTCFIGLVSEALYNAALKDLSKQGLPSWKSATGLTECSAVLKSLLAAERAHLAEGTAAALCEWIIVLEQEIQPALSGPRDTREVATIGQAWISTSLIMLRLYLPNVALDPIVARRTMANFNEFCQSQLKSALDLEIYAESATTGAASNRVIRDLQTRIDDTSKQLKMHAGEHAQAWRKPNLKLLSQFYRETSSFLREVVTPERVANLVQALISGPSEQAEQREASLQASLLSFGDRLRKTFAELRDMVEPILASLLQLQLGLRIVRQESRIAFASDDVKQRGAIVEALVAFPSARSTALLRQASLSNQLQARSQISASLLIVSATSVAYDRASLSTAVLESPDSLRNVSRGYERIFQLWALDRERAKREEEENSSLYKSRKIEDSIDMDAEAEEKEFRSLFPEYDDDILDGPRPSVAVNGEEHSMHKGMLLPPPRFAVVLHAHMAIFGSSSRGTASAMFQQERDSLVTKLMRQHHEDWSENIDKIGAAFGLSAAIDDQLASSQTSKDFNFYLDPRTSEVGKATVIVEELRARLSALIQNWPEQMVLQHIRDRCDAVLRLGAASPVAKMLSALEQLLTHTEDWEGFASKETSIQANRERISAQIIEWRRLELSCWAELLSTQASTFQDELGEWWFRVYEILIRGTRAASADGPEAFKDHVEQLIDAVDQFIRSSPLGQFEARLSLLESYARFIEQLVRLAPPKESQGLGEVGVVLHNVTAFFRQFDERISGTLQSQRAVLEKDILGFIKLASWKDINIHALKQSAHKTHRQLHKTLRKFRDILRQPVDPMLASHLDALTRRDIPALSVAELSRHRFFQVSEKLSAAWTEAVSFAGHNESAPEHIRNIVKTLAVLQKMSGDRLWPALLRPTSTATGIADLADEIVDRQQQLAKLTPAFSKEDNEKAIKNLTARKRKAWSDLLKELRRVGLSSFVKTDMAAMNQSVMHIYTRPALLQVCPASLSDEPFSTLERLFFRLLAALPKVRDSLQSHSPDLSTAELQRGVNYIEHITHLVLKERDRMHSELLSLSSIEKLVERIRDLHVAGVGTVIRASQSAPFQALSDFLARLADSLTEIQTQAPRFLATSAFPAGPADTLIGQLSPLAAQLGQKAASVEVLAKTAIKGGKGLFFVTEQERISLEAGRDLVENLQRDLFIHLQDLPALEALLHPVWKWISESLPLFDRCLDTLDAPLKGSFQPEIFVQQANTVISAVLQVAQDVRRAHSAVSSDPTDLDDSASPLSDKVVTTELHTLQTQQAMLRSSSVFLEVEKLLHMAQQLARDTDAEEMVQVQLAAVYPFLCEYSELLRAHLLASAHYSRSLLKLDHTLCHLLTALASKGFCKPPEEQQTDDDGQGEDGEQLEGGTGLGDGSGAKDITDQMEDDEDIEELQKDGPDDEGDDGDKTEREKNAKEADQDFGGDLEDISNDGEDEDAGSDQGDDGDEQEPEEAIGDVDPLDPNAVDEKVWDGNNDDEEESKDAPEDKTNKDLGSDNADGKEAESVPKADDAGSADEKQKQERPAEGSRDDQPQPDEQQQEQGDADQQDGSDDQDAAEPEEREGEEGEGGEEEDDEDADVQGEGGGRQLDQEAEQGQNLDLDDDLNMDGGDGESDGDRDDDDDLDDVSDMEKMPDEDQRDDRVDDKAMDDLVDDPTADDKKQNDETAEGEADEPEPEEIKVDKDEGEDAMDEDGEEEGPEPQSKQQKPANDDPSVNQQDQVDPFDIDAVDQGADDGGQDESANQQQSSRSQRGRRVDARNDQSQADEGNDADESPDAAPREQAEQPPSAGQSGAHSLQTERQEATADQEQDGEAGADPNPLRRMGDALEQFRRRMQEIQNAREEEEEQVSGDRPDHDGEGLPEDIDVEHVANDDAAELQALGAAQEQDEVRKLGDLGIEDEDESLAPKPRGQDVNEQEGSEQHEPQPLPDQPTKDQRDEVNDGQQKAFMPSDLKPPSASLTAEQKALLDRDGDANMADEVHVKKEEDEDDEAMTPLPDDVREEVDDEVQQQLEAFRNVASSEERLAQAAELWRSYASLTADLAFSLCEQLRLILAPTLATRLNGDFRTGKRLNMRKIVPFIASDFAKDKIWLRRTKPSSREYQVMLAIDDSRSMSESRSAHLAYQTLALVTGALSRLEVGDVSICRFGEDVDSLHDFGKGSFNDQNGAHVIDRLGFQQKKTNVLKLVEKSLETLAEARASRSSSSASQGGDLWQLEIIISDGICQDHAKLRSLLRRAAEQRVMLVFVVIDSLQSKPATVSGASTPVAKPAAAQQPRGSILDMTNASYYTDANGRLQLKMERYMDTFPFDYYVVVREVEALPEVLSATLRQWVEKIRETES
ncbi:hypothetical protein PHSY_006075 [Pseudozyma hubeiensis SY62]|uniref:Midasin n=1 Tax=Pseudozyma hubeiensis (strain SY62) TaxID=1305764 RepID=R9PAS9_PSEHS|nr:hypothetical protein PHSY_006075 [Pseudozyma hubeiensis SY62]GAC98481.1 hypothetical protein PHSY_006075 [Pseudozyma hubeiensis SY62]